MPGIFGIVNCSDGDGVQAVLAEMLARAQHYPWYVTESHRDAAAGVGLGRVSLGLSNTARQPVSCRGGAVVALMDGELYDYPQQRRDLAAAGCQFTGQSHAEVLLHGYHTGGREFFRRLSGKFVAAIWDASQRRLIAVNDRFGMRPLYYAKLPGKLLLASQLKSLLVDPQVPRVPGLRGIAQFFTYGQYLGEDTALEAVRVLPPAAWLVYEPDHDRLAVERYWQFSAAPGAGCPESEWLERLDAAFKRAVDCRVSPHERLGLSLSGGLDARTILAVIDHSQVPITSVALGMDGCSDHRSAAQLAALSNRRHHNYVLRPDFLASFEEHLRRMVHLTDGQYLSQCVVMPTLPFYRELGIEVLLRGHAGELMHMTKAYNFSLDRRALGLRSQSELEAWAFGHLRAYMLEGVDGPLLDSMHGGALDALARESLREGLRESAGMAPPVQRLWHLFLTQRVRRETALSLVKFGSLMETRLPYLDNELVDLLLAAPPELKLAETIQGYILRRRRPEFLDVVNVNTGTRVGAGAVARKLASLRQRVLAKLRVHGYQPYERMGLWLRRELRPLLEQTLLSPRCLDRGILRADTVRSVVAQHCEHRRNHTFLLLALLIFELGQRFLVDEDHT